MGREVANVRRSPRHGAPPGSRPRILRWVALVVLGLLLTFAAVTGLAKRAAEGAIAVRGAILETSRGPVEYSVQWPAAGLEGKANAISLGVPAVLLVHGTPGGNAQVVPLAKRLASAGFAAITFSRPGYFGTPLATGPTFENQADLAVDLLRSFGFHDVAVVAISGGGAVALQIALRHPERVRALAMIAAVTFEPADVASTAPRLPGWRNDLRARLAVLWPRLALRFCGVTEPAERRRLAGDSRLQLRLRVLFASLAFSPLTNAGYLNDYVQAGLENPADYPLLRIRAPTLGIYGEDDVIVPPAHGQRLVREIPGGRLQLLPGGHAFFILHEEPVLARLVPFLEEHLVQTGGQAAAAPAANVPNKERYPNAGPR